MIVCNGCKKEIEEGIVGVCPDCGKITCEECIKEKMKKGYKKTECLNELAE